MHSCATLNASSTEPVPSTSVAPLNVMEQHHDRTKNNDNKTDGSSSSTMTSQNLETDKDNASTASNDAALLPSTRKSAPLGKLSVTYHGLHKPKTDHRFKCKECNFVATSRKEANDHHKEKHDKCYCNVCGKACNTPSTLARHVYSHREELPFPCGDCDLKFAFKGQLKQHRFKHHTLSAFPCSKCDKSYKQEGELVKHLKVHENKTLSCRDCKYNTKDPRNLKQHAKLHTENSPYMCDSCNKFFQFWMQKKCHVCSGSANTSSEEF